MRGCQESHTRKGAADERQVSILGPLLRRKSATAACSSSHDGSLRERMPVQDDYTRDQS